MAAQPTAGQARRAGQPRQATAVSPASLITPAGLADPVGPPSLPSSGRDGLALFAGAAARLATAPRQIARGLMPRFHWSVGKQFKYLNWLWSRESSWDRYAENPYTGAYGIPQAVPGSKMSSAGPDWRSNPATQIRWGLDYIQGRYGSPLRAWDHELAYGWY